MRTESEREWEDVWLLESESKLIRVAAVTAWRMRCRPPLVVLQGARIIMDITTHKHSTFTINAHLVNLSPCLAVWGWRQQSTHCLSAWIREPDSCRELPVREAALDHSQHWWTLLSRCVCPSTHNSPQLKDRYRELEEGGRRESKSTDSTWTLLRK